MKILIILLVFISVHGCAQTMDPPKIITEQRGNITNIRAEGSLASAQVLGCIPLTQVKNTFTPPDLYKGVAECISQEKYDLAAELFAIAGVYSRFDAARVADKTARQARSVLIMNTFANISEVQKKKFTDAFTSLSNTSEKLGKVCMNVREIGAPSYYPSYMILHGMRAFMGNPHEGALLKDFEASKEWLSLQKSYLHCIS